MKLVAAILTFFSFGGTCLATPQVCDQIIYKGVTRAMCATPLEYYYRDKSLRPEFQFRPDAPILNVNWRGYIATWELQENLWYLVEIQSYICEYEHSVRKDCKKVELKDLFGEKCEHGRVFAQWFSGELEIPDGKVIQKASDANAVHERNIVLQIESGRLIKTTIEKFKKKHWFF